MNKDVKTNLLKNIKSLPTSPGVYLFTDNTGNIIYIGKAKNLRSRASSYIQKSKSNFKVNAIVSDSMSLSHIPTKTELEAMLLEAKLIQSNQSIIYFLKKDSLFCILW